MTNYSSSRTNIDDTQAAGLDQAIAAPLEVAAGGVYVPTSDKSTIELQDRRWATVLYMHVYVLQNGRGMDQSEIYSTGNKGEQ